MATKLRGEQLDLSDVVNDIEASLDTIYLRQDNPVLGGNLDVNGFRVQAAADSYLELEDGAQSRLFVNDVLTIESGDGQTATLQSSTTTGNGGNAQLRGGLSTGGQGGPANVRGGQGATFGGNALVLGGNGGSSAGGTVTIGGGNSTSSAGGGIILQTGGGPSGDGNVLISPSTVAGSLAPELRFREDLASGASYIALKAPANVGTSRTWSLPPDNPATHAGEFLTTDASGNLSFAPAVAASTTVANHVRAGNTQLQDGSAGGSSFNIRTQIAEDVFETIGPTGSGATNIWTGMDVLPSNARILLVDIEISLTSTGSTANDLFVYAASNDVASPASDNSTRIAGLQMKADTAVAEISETFVRCMIPLDANQVFKMTFDLINVGGSSGCSMYYRGFMTD